MDMKRRILSCFLAFCMIFALLPAPAQAAGNAENAAPTVKATVQHAETGQITAQIEAYMTDPANKTRTVKPCDIIFLIEQSKFKNTQNADHRRRAPHCDRGLRPHQQQRQQRPL